MYDTLCIYFGPVFTKVFAKFKYIETDHKEQHTLHTDDICRVKLTTEITKLFDILDNPNSSQNTSSTTPYNFDFSAVGDMLSVYHLIWRYREEIDDILPFLDHMMSEGRPKYSQFQLIQNKIRHTPRIPVYYKLLSLIYIKENNNHEISESEYQYMLTDLQPILNGIQSPSTSYIMYTNLVQAYLHTLYSSRHTPHCTTYDIMYVILVALLFLLVGLSIASVLKCR